MTDLNLWISIQIIELHTRVSVLRVPALYSTLHKSENSTNGSWWIVQVHPTNVEASLENRAKRAAGSRSNPVWTNR
jgi:hypothetical protein